jgi:hypothetical protein
LAGGAGVSGLALTAAIVAPCAAAAGACHPAEITSTQTAAAKTRRHLFFGLSCTVSSQSLDEAFVRRSAMRAPQPPLHRNTKITGT